MSILHYNDLVAARGAAVRRTSSARQALPGHHPHSTLYEAVRSALEAGGFPAGEARRIAELADPAHPGLTPERPTFAGTALRKMG